MPSPLPVGPRLEQAIDARLQLATAETRLAATEAAERAARVAIETTQAENLKVARSLSQAAGEARRQAWLYFGGFWSGWSPWAPWGPSWLLAAFWITGRGDARAFGKYPCIFCTRASGQVVEQQNGSSFCAIWIERPFE